MIKVRIQGSDGKKCATTALVDSGVSKIFIDKAYVEASRIPVQQKTTPRHQEKKNCILSIRMHETHYTFRT